MEQSEPIPFDRYLLFESELETELIEPNLETIDPLPTILESLRTRVQEYITRENVIEGNEETEESISDLDTINTDYIIPNENLIEETNNKTLLKRICEEKPDWFLFIQFENTTNKYIETTCILTGPIDKMYFLKPHGIILQSIKITKLRDSIYHEDKIWTTIEYRSSLLDIITVYVYFNIQDLEKAFNNNSKLNGEILQATSRSPNKIM